MCTNVLSTCQTRMVQVFIQRNSAMWISNYSVVFWVDNTTLGTDWVINKGGLLGLKGSRGEKFQGFNVVTAFLLAEYRSSHGKSQGLCGFL